jgi:hypothetical protein
MIQTFRARSNGWPTPWPGPRGAGRPVRWPGRPTEPGPRGAKRASLPARRGASRELIFLGSGRRGRVRPHAWRRAGDDPVLAPFFWPARVTTPALPRHKRGAPPAASPPPPFRSRLFRFNLQSSPLLSCEPDDLVATAHVVVVRLLRRWSSWVPETFPLACASSPVRVGSSSIRSSGAGLLLRHRVDPIPPVHRHADEDLLPRRDVFVPRRPSSAVDPLLPPHAAPDPPTPLTHNGRLHLHLGMS